MGRPFKNPQVNNQIHAGLEGDASIGGQIVPVEFNAIIKKGIETGIPLSRIKFHGAVDNANQVPTHYFSIESAVKDRNCEMWASSIGWVIFKQKNARGKDCYFLTPNANVICGDVKDES